jgi:hypothetical protein
LADLNNICAWITIMIKLAPFFRANESYDSTSFGQEPVELWSIAVAPGTTDTSRYTVTQSKDAELYTLQQGLASVGIMNSVDVGIRR